ncbi:MAG: PPOX class F420-dependent oxidoreductase [Streptosporangiaceae bacterium]
MQLDRAREFMRVNHRAVLSTFRSDGLPQLSPITVGVGDDGRVLVSTRETAMKTKNLARDPRASLCVMTDGFFGDWVQAEGNAEIVHLPEAMDLLVGYYRRVSGEHPDWGEYRQAMVRDQRVIVAITLTRAGPDRSG